MKRNILKLFFLLTSLILISVDCLSNAPIITFDKKIGLSNNYITDAVYDKLGFIWIVTGKNLERFDGKRISHYSFSDFSSSCKKIDMTLDYHGNLIVLDDNGIIYSYRYSINSFEKLFDLGIDLKASSFRIINNGNDSFLITIGEKLYLLSIKKGNFKLIIECHGIISELLITENDRIFFSSGRNLYKLDNRKPINIFSEENNAINSRIRCLKYNKGGNIYIGTQSDGLYSFDTEKNILSRIGENLLNNLPITDISIVDSTLYVATSGEGLYVFSTINNKLIRHITEDSNYFSIKDNSIKKIIPLKDNILFLGYYRYGFSIMSMENEKFHRIIHTPSDNRLSKNIIGGIYEISENIIWFGTTNGISQWDKISDKWEHLKSIDNQRHNNLIYDIEVVNGEYWLGSSFLPVMIFNKNGSKRELSKPYLNMVRSIEFDKYNTLCIANNNSTYIYNVANGIYKKIEIYNVQDVIYESFGKKFLMATLNGVYEYNIEDSTYNKVVKNIVSRSIEIRPDGIIVIGADNGIYFYNQDFKLLKKTDYKEGLKKEKIMSVISDDNCNIWCTTESGLFSISKDYKISFYDDMDNNLRLDYNQNSCLKDSRGNIYLGSNEGVVWFTPDEIKSNFSNMKLYVSEMYVSGRLMYDSPLYGIINDSNKLVLPYNQNNLSLYFTDYNYNPSLNNSFEWMLEGWNEWTISDDYNISLINLVPGKYKLMIRNATTKEICFVKNIIIRPPFWMTPTAYFVYVIFLLTIVFISIKRWNRRINQKYSNSALSLIMNTIHDIKTPLSIIYSIIDDSINETKENSKINGRLKLALRNAQKIQKYTVDILDIKNGSKHISVNNTDFNISELLRAKVAGFEILAHRKDMNITLIQKQEDIIINSDPNIIDRIIDNIISNAIKYSSNGQSITIVHKYDKNTQIILVSDNGIGIPKKSIKDIFRPYYRAKNAEDMKIEGSGIGLLITKKFTTLLGGDINIQSQIDKGTTVTVKIPYKKKQETMSYAHETTDIETVEQVDIEKPVVLIADDNFEFSSYICNRLKEANFLCEIAQNGKEALEKLRSKKFDLLITDNEMPLIGGIELTIKIKNDIEICHIPIIMLSGYDDKQNMIKALDAGVEKYLVKPITADLLISNIKSIFDNRKKIYEKIKQGDYKNNEIKVKNDLDNEFMEKINKSILDNIDNPEWGVTELAEMMLYSRTSLYNKLKGITGITPNEYIKTIRLAEGKKILLTAQFSISEVAYKVGFTDAKYFGTCFRKQYGITPSEFISQQGNKS